MAPLLYLRYGAFVNTLPTGSKSSLFFEQHLKKWLTSKEGFFFLKKKDMNQNENKLTGLKIGSAAFRNLESFRENIKQKKKKNRAIKNRIFLIKQQLCDQRTYFI